MVNLSRNKSVVLEVNRVYYNLVMDGLKLIADNSINSIITSPPYWQLRDYGFDGQYKEKIFTKTGDVVNYGGKRAIADVNKTSASSVFRTGNIQQKEFKGFTDCGCNAGFEGGIVLDPFAGTGTTLARALSLGRRALGFDGKEEYVNEANKELSLYVNQGNLNFNG
jgi:DNA modification methylase